jgi:hypothetical protein
MNDQSHTADPSAIKIHCVLMHSKGLADTAYFGTKAQLVIAGLATNSMFSPKRHRAYSPKKKFPEYPKRSLKRD